MSNRCLIPAFFLCLAISLLAEDITTLDGRLLKSVRVSSETPTHVKIMHDEGVVLVKKTNLPAAFLTLHELTPAPEEPGDKAMNDSKLLLAAFVANVPTFKTKDGRQFNSTDIFAVEPSGLRIRNDAGILSLKFTELPESVRLAFRFDAQKASDFETSEKARQLERQANLMKEANAASVVDTFSSQVRLRLLQNIGKGWLCEADILDRLDGLSAQEKVVSHSDRLMVFGLPLYGQMPSQLQDTKLWSGQVYRVGNYDFVSASTGFTTTIAALHTDRSTAIRWLSKNGTGANYAASGDANVEAKEEEPKSGTFSGTGFAISNDGYVATAAHVIERSNSISVRINGRDLEAVVMATDDARDIAILWVRKAQTKALKLRPLATVKIGGEVFCVGYPLVERLGRNAKLTKGQLNAHTGLKDSEEMFQMSAQIQPGNSGGPVCNELGQVIGIVSKTGSTIAGASGGAGAVPQNVNFATKADVLIELSKKVPRLKLESEEGDTKLSPEELVIGSTFLITVEK